MKGEVGVRLIAARIIFVVLVRRCLQNVDLSVRAHVTQIWEQRNKNSILHIETPNHWIKCQHAKHPTLLSSRSQTSSHHAGPDTGEGRANSTFKKKAYSWLIQFLPGGTKNSKTNGTNQSILGENQRVRVCMCACVHVCERVCTCMFTHFSPFTRKHVGGHQ